MGELHRAGERLEQRRGEARRLGLAGDLFLKRPAVDKLERKIRQAVVLANLVNLDDVRVLQSSDRAGLLLEALQLFRAGVRSREDHLQRDEPVQALLARLVDDAHAAAAEFGND